MCRYADRYVHAEQKVQLQSPLSSRDGRYADGIAPYSIT